MKRYYNKFLVLVILALLIFFVLKDVDFYELYYLFKAIRPIYFILAFSSCLFAFLILTFRLKYFLRAMFKAKYFFLLRVLFAGAFVNTITPSAGFAGEPFKAYYIGRKHQKSKNKVLGILLGDKFFHLLMFSFLIVFSILFILIYINIPGSLKFISEIFLVSVLFGVSLTIFLILRKLNFNLGAILGKVYFFRFFKKRFKTIDAFERYVNEKIKEFSGVFRKIVKNPKNIFMGVLLSMVCWLLDFLIHYFLFRAFGFEINFLSIMVVVTLGILIGTTSFIPGGIGLVEGSMILLYSAMGIHRPLALLVAFFARIIYYFFSLLVGGLSLVYLRKTVNGK